VSSILTSVRRWVPDNIARHVRVDRRLTVNGRLFKIPIRDGIGFDHLNPREEWLDVVLRTLLPKRQGTFINVGVNIGQTLLKVKSFDDGRPYVGFEPNPICCCYCDDLIRLNNIRQVTIVPSGCGVARSNRGVVCLCVHPTGRTSPGHTRDLLRAFVFVVLESAPAGSGTGM
jgi:hypothetical protein